MTKPKSVARDRLVDYLDGYLNVATIQDDSPNGLQVEGNAKVSKLAFAVDASLTTIRAAARINTDMLIVHHGLFWGRHQQIVGNMYRRISSLVENNLSLYAVHLPLDAHPEVGNNVELARLLGLEIVGRFALYKGIELGTLTRLDEALHRDELKNIVETTLGTAADMLPFGPSNAKRIGVISGEAAMFAEEAKRHACDTLITGETSHTAYNMARDARINVIYGGHYATETVGLKALARHLKKMFGITGRFIPAPTGY
ncbi:MAG: Nif3-like dinuclear metal center hexameric protein [Candidatus Krumholzibacteria bacterium]|nr:Nif3-like dinuclear metal center hexameric protein [Candidatus Krumholzibacteria bacterium]